MGCSVGKHNPRHCRSILDKNPNNFSLSYTCKRRYTSEPPFRILPDELLMLIINSLDYKSLSNISKVNMYLQNITQPRFAKIFSRKYKYPPRVYPGYPTFRAYHYFIHIRRNWIIRRENNFQRIAKHCLRVSGQSRIDPQLVYLHRRKLDALPRLPHHRPPLLPAFIYHRYYNTPASIWEEMVQNDFGLIYYCYRITQKAYRDFNSYVFE